MLTAGTRAQALRSARCSSSIVHRGQDEAERGAVAGYACDGKGAPLALDEIMAEQKAQPAKNSCASLGGRAQGIPVKPEAGSGRRTETLRPSTSKATLTSA